MDRPVEPFVMPYLFQPLPAELSTIEQLRTALESHREEEEKFLKIYDKAIERHDSPLVKFVLELVRNDEETHHQVLGRIIARLDSDLAWRKDADTLPRLGELTKAERRHMIEMTEEFIDEEKQGIAKCKVLLKMAKGCYRGLITLILRTMIHDSEKHIMLLRFIRTQIKEATPVEVPKRSRAF